MSRWFTLLALAAGTVQLSTIRLDSSLNGANQRTDNRQWTGTLSRRIYNHTVRLTARDMRLATGVAPAKQHAIEAEDTFQMRRLVFGGAVRAQQAITNERQNSFYFRGSAQINLGRFTAFGYYEGGKDLVNQSVFATSATSSSVLSGSYRFARHWSAQAEAYRTRLVSSLNPENIFPEAIAVKLENGSIVTTDRDGRFRFPAVAEGAHEVGIDMEQLPADFNPGGTVAAKIVVEPRRIARADFDVIALTSFSGAVVFEDGSRSSLLEGILVRLEPGGHYTTTNKDGSFSFYDLPEGTYDVVLAQDTLPADVALEDSAVKGCPRIDSPSSIGSTSRREQRGGTAHFFGL